MAGIKDAFLGDRIYPDSPGFKEPTTARDAAVLIKRRAPELRGRVLAAIAAAGPTGLTPDEAAEKVGQTVLAVRPRVTELKELKQIERTGGRRANASGALAHCWRVKNTMEEDR